MQKSFHWHKINPVGFLYPFVVHAPSNKFNIDDLEIMRQWCAVNVGQEDLWQSYYWNQSFAFVNESDMISFVLAF